MPLSPSLQIIDYKRSCTPQGFRSHSMNHNTDEVQTLSMLSHNYILQICAKKLTTYNENGMEIKKFLQNK